MTGDYFIENAEGRYSWEFISQNNPKKGIGSRFYQNNAIVTQHY